MFAERGIGGNQSARPSGGMHARPVDAAAIIGDLYDDSSTAMGGRYTERSLRSLAARNSVVGCFDPVIDGIAHHVGHGIDEAFDHGAIHLGRLALDDEIDL